jgi:hypothetical protein
VFSSDLPGVNPTTLNGMILYYHLMTKWSDLGDSTKLSRAAPTPSAKLLVASTPARLQQLLLALFAWLISHQPAVLFSQNKPATSNQPTVLFSRNKPAPVINHQPTEQAGYLHHH